MTKYWTLLGDEEPRAIEIEELSALLPSSPLPCESSEVISIVAR
ncbi:MAG: hypothetical protein WB975_06640 [Nitrososphaeraceae archaeon]